MMWFCHHSWSWGMQWGFCWPSHCTAATTTSVPDAFSGICHYAMTSSDEFSLSELSLPAIHYVVCWCLLWCLFIAFRVPCGCHAFQWVCCGAIIEYTLGRHMCFLVMVCGPYQKCNEWLFLSLLQVGGSFMLLMQQSLSHSIYFMGHTALEAWQRVPNPSTFPTLWGRVFFSGFGSIHWHSWLWIWWALKLVILVLSLGIRLMILLTPGLHSGLLLIHTFTLGTWVSCHHLPTSVSWRFVFSVSIDFWYFETTASGFVNYGARLGHFFHLCLWPPRSQHLNWFPTFLATQQLRGPVFNTTR